VIEFTVLLLLLNGTEVEVVIEVGEVTPHSPFKFFPKQYVELLLIINERSDPA